MKLYGYTQKARRADSKSPEKMAEVTLVASPAQLRKIAAFIENAAREMEEMGDTFNHVHLESHQKGFANSPQFVIFNPKAKA
ncbi:MAG TPA: hypothetical protein VH105_25965 [Burkholderiales bacterium]|jgi:hypothetical protein|nr:hypothetical protein [Burkholderiales bacterium]